jgi:hypothetical protein
VAGNGITLSQRTGGGEVQVTLNRDISRCAYLANTARLNGPDPGVVANVEAIDATRLRVVRAFGGTGVDVPFSPAIFC